MIQGGIVEKIYIYNLKAIIEENERYIINMVGS